jgi:phenylacetate-CoA ligase
LVKKAFIKNHLAFEGGILGRADDMMIVRGVNVHPSAVEEVIRAFPDVAEFRVEIRQKLAMAELTVVIEPSPSCGDAAQLAQRLETALCTAFSLRIPVTVVAAGTLPRFEMKAKRWVSVAD